MSGGKIKKNKIRITSITLGSETSQHSNNLLFILLLLSFLPHTSFCSLPFTLHILLILTSPNFPAVKESLCYTYVVLRTASLLLCSLRRVGGVCMYTRVEITITQGDN